MLSPRWAEREKGGTEGDGRRQQKGPSDHGKTRCMKKEETEKKCECQAAVWVTVWVRAPGGQVVDRSPRGFQLCLRIRPRYWGDSDA